MKLKILEAIDVSESEWLKQFFKDHPQLSAHGFAKETTSYWKKQNLKGISPKLLDFILKGERTLTDKTIEKIMPILIKYGYKNNEDESK